MRTVLIVPSGDDVFDAFNHSKERFRERDYEYDQMLAKLKGAEPPSPPK